MNASCACARVMDRRMMMVPMLEDQLAGAIFDKPIWRRIMGPKSKIYWGAYGGVLGRPFVR